MALQPCLALGDVGQDNTWLRMWLRRSGDSSGGRAAMAVVAPRASAVQHKWLLHLCFSLHRDYVFGILTSRHVQQTAKAFTSPSKVQKHLAYSLHSAHLCVLSLPRGHEVPHMSQLTRASCWVAGYTLCNSWAAVCLIRAVAEIARIHTT